MDEIKRITKKVPGIAVGIIILVIVFGLIQPKFFVLANFQNILKNASILTIVSMGMTMAVLSGQIDLSVGSVMSLSAVVTGIMLKTWEDPSAFQVALAILVGLGIGAVFGLFNGIMIGKYKFDFWLITFATMAIAKSLALIVTNGDIIAGYNKTYRTIGDGDIYGISSCIIVTIIVCMIIIFISTRTRFGYAIYSVGDSEKCAFQSGIKVVKTRIKIYVFSGLLAAFGGIMLASKTNSASSTIGTGYEFNAIAAVLVGGTPFTGGKGGLLGTVLGGLLITTMKSGLQSIGLSVYWQTLLIGLFIMIIIIMDTATTKRRTIKEQRRTYKDV